MPPGYLVAHSSIKLARWSTNFKASSNPSTPLAVMASYSPRLKPSTASGFIPSAFKAS